MDITYNKVDETALPISVNRVSASEYNQIAASLMNIINTSGVTPDVADNAQLLNALKAMGSGWAMPSSTYTSLTVGASGTSYTASSTGFVFVNAMCSIGGYCCVYSNQLETISQSYNNTTVTNWVPVKKGESFQLNYSLATINSFIFVYAEGSKSEAN